MQSEHQTTDQLPGKLSFSEDPDRLSPKMLPLEHRDAGSAVTTIVIGVDAPCKSGGKSRVAPAGGAALTKMRNRPPLRFDRQFYYHKNNQLKMAQLACGAYCFLFTYNCYPNKYVGFCTGELVSFLQLFQLVCVNGFCFCATMILLACAVFGVHDTFYQYNFPILLGILLFYCYPAVRISVQEKLYGVMATSLYTIAAVLATVDFYRVRFSVLWPVHLATVLVTFGTYAYDLWLRWSANSPSHLAPT